MKTVLPFILTLSFVGTLVAQHDSTAFESLKGVLAIPVDRYTSFELCCIQRHNDASYMSLADPIEHQLHIHCDSNATAFSWASGEVSKTYASNGHWVVMLSHDNFVTVYSNLDNLHIEVGDKVNGRQALGTVAKSEDEYRLELELWKKGSKADRSNAEKLNPLEWLEEQ